MGINILVRIEKQLSKSSLIIQTLARFRNKTSSYNRRTLYCTMGRTRNPKSNTGDDEISEDDLSEERRLIVKILERKFETIVTKLTEES